MAKAFVGIMLVVIAKSGKQIYWLTLSMYVTLSNACNNKGFNCFLERLVTLSSVYLAAQHGNKLNTWNGHCGVTTVTTCITATTGSRTDP